METLSRTDLVPHLHKVLSTLGIGYTILKVRPKNRDIPTGKSGGYRIIYPIVSPQIVSLLLIYAKSDQSDVTTEEIVEAIEKNN